MATPITWKNINNPANSAGAVNARSGALDSSRSAFEAMSKSFDSAIKRQQGIRTDNRENTIDNNTQGFNDLRDQYDTPEEFEAAREQGVFKDYLSDKGRMIDQSLANKGALDSHMTGLRQAETADYNYQQTQQTRADSPWVDKFTSRINSINTEGGIEGIGAGYDEVTQGIQDRIDSGELSPAAGAKLKQTAYTRRNSLKGDWDADVTRNQNAKDREDRLGRQALVDARSEQAHADWTQQTGNKDSMREFNQLVASGDYDGADAMLQGDIDWFAPGKMQQKVVDARKDASIEERRLLEERRADATYQRGEDTRIMKDDVRSRLNTGASNLQEGNKEIEDTFLSTADSIPGIVRHSNGSVDYSRSTDEAIMAFGVARDEASLREQGNTESWQAIQAGLRTDYGDALSPTDIENYEDEYSLGIEQGLLASDQAAVEAERERIFNVNEMNRNPYYHESIAEGDPSERAAEAVSQYAGEDGLYSALGGKDSHEAITTFIAGALGDGIDLGDGTKVPVPMNYVTMALQGSSNKKSLITNLRKIMKNADATGQLDRFEEYKNDVANVDAKMLAKQGLTGGISARNSRLDSAIDKVTQRREAEAKEASEVEADKVGGSGSTVELPTNADVRNNILGKVSGSELLSQNEQDAAIADIKNKPGSSSTQRNRERYQLQQQINQAEIGAENETLIQETLHRRNLNQVLEVIQPTGGIFSTRESTAVQSEQREALSGRLNNHYSTLRSVNFQGVTDKLKERLVTTGGGTGVAQLVGFDPRGRKSSEGVNNNLELLTEVADILDNNDPDAARSKLEKLLEDSK